jgi:hypothetical protein
MKSVSVFLLFITLQFSSLEAWHITTVNLSSSKLKTIRTLKQTRPLSSHTSTARPKGFALYISPGNNNNYNNQDDEDQESRLSSQSNQERLKSLGFRPQDTSFRIDEEPIKVAVTEVDVDPLTLTAVGFSLIAFNFLIFANMGSGGIAGLVARIINTWDN